MYDDAAVLKPVLVAFCLERITPFEDFGRHETSSL